MIQKKLFLVKRIIRKCYGLYIKRDPKAIAYYDYLKNGGESLRLDYPLNKDAVVIDAGGYSGDFAADIVRKFDCSVEIFEPVEQYADKIRHRFSSNNKVNVVQAGLGGSNKEEYINIAGLGSSIFDTGSGHEARQRIRIISAADYLTSKGYPVIGLLKINIEGGEYELLRSLLDHAELINKIRFIQIQFHDFIPGAHEMRDQLRHALSRTHKLMWDYPFIWESWEKK